ncbi:MAG: efflux RND transporter periplasmic adaptor subunit [Thermodesulfovibrionales bacterium]|nr:efflux RND transporter periplasmic adaptor subunit [Thermodesulfovibrionales bacterium]
MPIEDINKLRIEKKLGFGKGRKKLFYAIGGMAFLTTLLIMYMMGYFTTALSVEVYTVSKIYPSEAYTLLNASGYIVPQKKAAVASKITGRLISLSVEEGSKLKKGDIIGRLENDDLVAIYKQALANLDTAIFNLQFAQVELEDAKSMFLRNQELLRHGFISQLEYDSSEARYKKAIASVSSAEANVNSAKAALEVAKLNIEYTFIRSPFDGVVLTKNADIGDIVTPLSASANAKFALVTMADLSSLQAEVDVSESNVRLIKIGQPCEIQLDAIADKRFDGVVHTIVPTADRSKASIQVKVKFIDETNSILPDMSVKVAFLSKSLSEKEKMPITVIKANAILEKEGKKYVYLIKDKSAKLVPITTGQVVNSLIEVKDGLSVGDKVIISSLDKLKDGMKVKIAQN